jgi:hypothetical protein
MTPTFWVNLVFLGRIFAKNGRIKGRNPILLDRMACAVTHVEFFPHPSQKMALFPLAVVLFLFGMSRKF